MPASAATDLPAVFPADLARRVFLARAGQGGLLAVGALALPGCATAPRYSLAEAVRDLLFVSSQQAFARMTAANGFWDRSVAQLGLANVLGARGNVLSGILTGPLFKSRLDQAFGAVALRASERAAPLVIDTVRTIGFANTLALIRGGPMAATGFLRQEMGMALVTAMVPEIGMALRLANEPLVGQALSALTGVDVAGVANRFAGSVDDVIWGEIGREEAAIRADPAATRRPSIMAVFGAARAL